MNSIKKYLVDGRYFTQEEILALFNHGRVDIAKLDSRQKACIDMIDGSMSEFEKAPFLVDIGCYAGIFLEAVNILFPEIQTEGVDYFEDHIEIASLLYPKKNNRFKKMTVYQLDYDDESIDMVTLQEVIEHLHRPVDAVREINRVLKTGGYLIISTPNACSLRTAVFSMFFECKNAVRGLLGVNLSVPHEIFFENVEWNRHIYTWTSSTLNTLLLSNRFDYVEHRIVSDCLWERLMPGSGSVLVFKARKTKASPETII